MDGSLHQEEAGQWADGGRSGAGTASAGSSNVYKKPLPGRAGALWQGARLRACGPHETSPGKENSTEERFETVRVRRAASGPGAGLANARKPRARRGFRREGRRGASGGERGWGAAGSRKHRPMKTSATASPGFCPRARASGSPTPGVEGGKRGGKGAELARGHRQGAAPGRAPCRPQGAEARQGGGAVRQGPGAPSYNNGSLPPWWAVRRVGSRSWA